MNTIKLFLFAFFLAGTTALGAPLKIKSSEVTFLAVGSPGFLEIEGTEGKLTADGLSLEGTIVKGKVKVKLAEVTTDMDLRDRHMHEKYFEVTKFPWAVLDLDPSDLKSGKFTGTLTLKGDSKKVSGKLSGGGGKIEASFTISIKNYPALGVPSWLGVTIADEVQVKVKATVE